MAASNQGPVDPEFLNEKRATYSAFLKRSFYAAAVLALILLGMALFLL